MIRKNPPKPNTQRQVYYTHRFDVSPTSPTFELSESTHTELSPLFSACSILQSYVQNDLITLWIDSQQLLACFQILHDLGYQSITEMSAIDRIQDKNEFELFYLLLKLEDTSSKRLKIKTSIKNGQSIQSICSLYRSAFWSERECYDMFGIIFDNHPCLQRLLMPKDWVGHPLLKTYPLKGDEHASWYEVDKIFGKSYRDIIGKEQRDSARIDPSDSKDFAPISYEARYQEENAPAFLKKFGTTKKLEERR